MRVMRLMDCDPEECRYIIGCIKIVCGYLAMIISIGGRENVARNMNITCVPALVSSIVCTSVK